MSTYFIELNESHVAALAALFASSSFSSPISLEAVLCSLASKRQLTIENGKPQPRPVRITVTGSSLSELLESFRVAIITTTWPVSRELSNNIRQWEQKREQRLFITDTTPHPRKRSTEWFRPEWIDWRYAHMPKNSLRWMAWHGLEWVNGPRYSYGERREPELTTTRFDSEFPPQHLCLRTLCIERFVCLVYK